MFSNDLYPLLFTSVGVSELEDLQSMVFERSSELVVIVQCRCLIPQEICTFRKSIDLIRATITFHRKMGKRIKHMYRGDHKFESKADTEVWIYETLRQARHTFVGMGEYSQSFSNYWPLNDTHHRRMFKAGQHRFSSTHEDLGSESRGKARHRWTMRISDDDLNWKRWVGEFTTPTPSFEHFLTRVPVTPL